jgi:hypothetical protein
MFPVLPDHSDRPLKNNMESNNPAHPTTAKTTTTTTMTTTTTTTTTKIITSDFLHYNRHYCFACLSWSIILLLYYDKRHHIIITTIKYIYITEVFLIPISAIPDPCGAAWARQAEAYAVPKTKALGMQPKIK